VRADGGGQTMPLRLPAPEASVHTSAQGQEGWSSPPSEGLPLSIDLAKLCSSTFSCGDQPGLAERECSEGRILVARFSKAL
jgi:hypothetical protein